MTPRHERGTARLHAGTEPGTVAGSFRPTLSTSCRSVNLAGLCILAARPSRGPAPGRARRPGRIRSIPFLAAVVLGLVACDGTSPTGSLQEVVEETVDGGGETRTDGDGRDDGNGPSGGEGSASSDFPNLPSGFSRITETSYATPTEGGWRSSTNSNFSIVSDGSAPKSGSTVAQARFPAGLGDGRSPIWSERSLAGAGATKLYVSFWIKVSRNWQGHGTGVNKSAIIWTHGEPVVVANLLGKGSGRLTSEIRIQDTPDGARNLGPTLASPEILRGRWHRWEILLVSNTGDAGDGQIHWWIDGEKVGEYRDVRFGRSGDSKTWDTATWRPVWGGRGDTVRETMHMWMDHYFVAGAR